MSKPVPTINRYKADLRELSFLLFEQFRVDELLGKAPFEAWGRDECVSALAGCYRWVREVIGPLNAIGDAQGCTLAADKVQTPQGFKSAWQSLYQAGWKQIGVDPEWGGAGAPSTVQVLIEEMLSGANTAFQMYSGLTLGAAEVIHAFGTDTQKQLYCPRMFDGRWGGTMCLTEPQAGSDVGSAKTSASHNPDGSYSIRGTKIFISAGDHDLTENIVHLVLARVDGAPAGTKGLTLFIVPKIRVGDAGALGDPNDVQVVNLEHKMGINGSATCVLSFGDSGRCIGWPVGGDSKLNQGMPQMFKLMNNARIAVGIQGISVASSAFLNALEYAKERRQGSSMKHWKDATAPRVPIIDHADVRRMLIDMKARVEGVRALAVKLAHHTDRARALEPSDEAKVAYHQGQVDLLVPLVKAYGSDQGFRVCETAIQTFGGVGYTRDFPVEQYCRDAKIFSIYEGTNHIQAMDLVGRKLGQSGGANLQAFLADIARFVQKRAGDPTLGPAVKTLSVAQEALGASAMRMLMWFQTGSVAMVPLHANRFLEMMAETAVSWMLLEGAGVALEARNASARAQAPAPGSPDASFYEGKIAAALYYARNVLPSVELKARLMAEEDRTPLDISDDAFATV
ncbi:MAG TPA: acyl-CoA dehydrogenase [Polyangiaceae bacterium]|nr:acyl-CoA dehydrogenase [Polyangiaceae bacterium]